MHHNFYRIAAEFFLLTDKPILKFIRNFRPRIVETNLKNKNKIGEFAFAHFYVLQSNSNQDNVVVEQGHI